MSKDEPDRVGALDRSRRRGTWVWIVGVGILILLGLVVMGTQMKNQDNPGAGADSARRRAAGECPEHHVAVPGYRTAWVCVRGVAQ